MSKYRKTRNAKAAIFHIRLSAFIVLSFFAMATYSLPQPVITEEKLEETLKRLDEAIDQKAHYSEVLQMRCDSMKLAALHSKGKEKTEIYWQLYDIYRRVQTDSALYYLNELSEFPDIQGKTTGESRIKMCRAEVYGVMGMYSISINMLNDIDATQLPPDLRLKYFHILRTIYGWFASYVRGTTEEQAYSLQTDAYRDSIIANESDSVSRHIVMADKLLVEGKASSALELLDADLADTSEEYKRYIYINKSEAHRQLGDDRSYTYYLALAAIGDIQNGVREYMALPALARELYEEGDVSRAYRYLFCSLEDATSCKARLRAIETGSILPIIDKAYKDQESAQHRTERIMMLVLILFSLVLASVLLLLHHQNGKLNSARSHLLEANDHLQQSNEELAKADKVKEEYIAIYLDKCRGYLEALQKYRRDLLKLAKSKQNEALLKRLDSSDLMDAEQQRFYKDFDEAFLNIHPHFVERFNALLEEGHELVPKRGELLTTELRIFALIRLGVSDTGSIAQFLNYSPSTVYNYRSRVKSHARGGKESFESAVMTI
jgi:hypothetical protein